MDAKLSFIDRAQLKRRPSIHDRQSTPTKRAKSTQAFSCCSSMMVVENYNNFRKSGIPARFMYLYKGDWIDFPGEAVCLLQQGFQIGKTAVEIAMHGSSSYLVDFLRMSRIDLNDGCHRWIAWIDIHGNCFFPRVFCQEDPSLDIKIDRPKPFQTGECEVITTNKNGKPTVVKSESESTLEQGSSDSVIGEDYAQFPECHAAAAASGGIPNSGASTSASPELESDSLFCGYNNNNLMIKLQDGDREFAAVRERFLGGLSTLATLTTVVGIYRSVSRQARLRTFRRHAEDVARKSVDGKAKHEVYLAWHF